MTDGADNEFVEWLSATAEHYKALSDEERNTTLDTLIDASSPSQMWRLQYQLQKLLYRDFLRCLPKELQDYLLLYLDPQTLLSCCQVCHAWNSIINGNAQIWFKACKMLDLQLNTARWYTYSPGTWKTLFLSMLRLQKDLRNREAFRTDFLNGHTQRVSAVCYWNGKLATGADDKTVRIWDCTQDTCITILKTECSVSCIKLDESLLLLSSYAGSLKSFAWKTTQPLKTFLQHTAAVLTFDYCQDIDLVASGGADEQLRLWSLETGTLLNTYHSHSHWVVTVKIVPFKRSPGSYLLLSMDRSHIFVWPIPPKDAPLLNLSVSQRIPIAMTDFNFFTPGLHSDGEFIYFIKQDPRQFGSTQLCCWDVQKVMFIYKKELHMRVKTLMAVGKKYACIITPWIDSNDPNFIVFNLATLKTLARWHIPPSRPTTPGNSQLAFGDTHWLDGLSGSNHCGIVITAGLDDHSCYVLRWKEMYCS